MPEYYIEYDLFPTRAIWHEYIDAPSVEEARDKFLAKQTLSVKIRKIEQVAEQILVIPEDRISALGGATGFIEYDDDTFRHVVDPAYMQYLDRTDELEANPAWKQLIPYLVFCFVGENQQEWYFHYTRTKQQGESRLHGKRSIGVGGHINKSDIADDDSSRSPLWAGAKREMDEELHVYSHYMREVSGLLYDPSNEVGQVHLGVVILYYLELPALIARERSMANAGFVTAEQLAEEKDLYENWSQLCIERITKGAL